MVRELGRGGMGVVYLATGIELDQQVANVAVPAELAEDPDRLARFQREAKVLGLLNHPNVGGICGLEQADGHQYLGPKQGEGETLADRFGQGAIAVVGLWCWTNRSPGHLRRHMRGASCLVI